MREPIKDKGRLEHILECINNVYEFIGNKTFEQIVKDRMCYFAILHQFMIIGEASNLLTKEFREKHTKTPWRNIIGMRNYVVHGYDIVSKFEILSVLKNDLQPLKQQIEEYISEFDISEE
ncbi:MAG: DUF86 domain-containing protein [Bacteroidales bacterium]|nr:DUF86 domain-containing protein [Bacteroidales bacterium]